MENYRDIDLVDLVKKLSKFWWLIAFFTILASGVAYYYTKNYVVPIYESTTSIFIGK